MAVRSFKIDVPLAVLEDLRSRLAGIRWPEGLRDRAWKDGTSEVHLKELIDYWLQTPGAALPQLPVRHAVASVGHGSQDRCQTCRGSTAALSTNMESRSPISALSA